MTDLSWHVKVWRQPRRNRGGHRNAYALRLQTGKRTLFDRRWSAGQLRAFADTAVDALDGNYTTGERWGSGPFGGNRIEIIERRDTKSEHMVFSHSELEDVISQIDSILENK